MTKKEAILLGRIDAQVSGLHERMDGLERTLKPLCETVSAHSAYFKVAASLFAVISTIFTGIKVFLGIHRG